MKMPVKEQQLLHCSIFEPLRPQTREHLAQIVDEVVFEAGEVLYTQDDPPVGLYYLLEGYVILYRQSSEKSQILSLVQAGDCFGGESIANSKPSPYTAKVIAKTSIFYITPENLQNLIQDYPDFLSLFLTIVTQRLRQLTTVVHDLAFRDVAARVASVLLMLVEAGGQPYADGIHVPRVLSQQELAATVGTAREVVYRTLKQFEQQQILQKTSKQYIILDLEKLSEIASKEVD